ncbi:hypothetical protein GPECTOR_21g729 [Gonium pectorale]|uniref:Thioredoxin domain-containing protein n=1 Tax=Gonium pectorale TaxID=33097 RepID=A0A150GI60_GONPE|nr:hypothetical protein GPECTOR_21g729 [Gonium pectorale]|eukprot:KXZ49503.1 hypothetical protein GPECTOR_21g729 [Gonium pectorale]
MSRVQHIKSEEEWHKAMNECRSFGGKAMIVDFTAIWCGPCQRVAPVYDDLSSKFVNVAFLKVDVDELQEVAAECKVSAMPTFVGFFNGEEVEKIVGADIPKLTALLTTLNNKGGAGAGQKLGGASASAATDDSPEARRARMLAAVEARNAAAAPQ